MFLKRRKQESALGLRPNWDSRGIFGRSHCSLGQAINLEAIAGVTSDPAGFSYSNCLPHPPGKIIVRGMAGGRG